MHKLVYSDQRLMKIQTIIYNMKYCIFCVAPLYFDLILKYKTYLRLPVCAYRNYMCVLKSNR